MNILIIEDDLGLIEQLELGLQGKFNVCTANSTIDAKQLLLRQDLTFDVILADYNLGHSNAFELMKYIYDLPVMPKTIMMSGYATKDIVITALNSGIDHFLEKPFTIEKLINIIDSYSLIKIKIGSYLIDCNLLTISHKNEITKLTQIELNLFLAFYRNLNQIVTKQDLQLKVWGGECKARNNLGTHLTNLKSKLPILNDYLINVRGIGYLLQNPQD